MQGIAAFKKIVKDGRAKSCCLQEDSRGGESKMLLPLKEIISVCESKEKKERFFFSCKTYTRIIVIDLIIVKLFGICRMVFSFQKKGFST